MKHAQSGVTLIEIMIAVSIAAVLAASVALAGFQFGEQMPAARHLITGALTQAIAIAGTSGNGSTVQFESTTEQTTIRIYGGRPNGLTPDATPATLVREVSISVSLAAAGQNVSSAQTGPPFALFINSYGQATSGTWNGPGSAAQAPQCAPSGTPLTISIYQPGTQGPSNTMKIPCGGSAFSSFNANGQTIPDSTGASQ